MLVYMCAYIVIRSAWYALDGEVEWSVIRYVVHLIWKVGFLLVVWCYIVAGVKVIV